MTETPNAAAIRARLDEMSEPFLPRDEWGGAHTDNECWCRGTHAEGLHGFYVRGRDALRGFDALRAVLDLAADHDLCPALADCARDPSSCNELDITNTIATALGVGTP